MCLRPIVRPPFDSLSASVVAAKRVQGVDKADKVTGNQPRALVERNHTIISEQLLTWHFE